MLNACRGSCIRSQQVVRSLLHKGLPGRERVLFNGLNNSIKMVSLICQMLAKYVNFGCLIHFLSTVGKEFPWCATISTPSSRRKSIIWSELQQRLKIWWLLLASCVCTRILHLCLYVVLLVQESPALFENWPEWWLEDLEPTGTTITC